ncbi:MULTISPECIES: GTP cyclohydrolase II [Kitasatospora]|uniref:GTP cyclohydrolase II n=1 Tax=Kitasatospora setae (strain ATCC 33774 / DSM 43861 / JCM 3304 / KCC A-0304 / NBRC 14216 / KM-6054) TaxID=452652 RepID=E4N0K2_KITSK|nr:GTP cyclohydrolase II [Kitasatospora setae]BAJ31686.1 putative GTP cyclohydrolase II [Kitasatospora setae KM-6054]
MNATIHTLPVPTSVRARVPITLTRAAGRRAELVTFHDLPDGEEHLACLVPAAPGDRAPLVRLHSECLTGDVLGSERCDCGPQLDEAMRLIAAEGGAVLYLRQEGRGIGLYNKLDTYVLQEHVDTFTANRMIGRGDDERDYTAAAAMLRALGLTRIRLLTNNPDKVRELRAHGIEVAEVVPTGTHLTAENARYLAAKAELGGHTLALLQEAAV